jgi:copper chaperone CopZ
MKTIKNILMLTVMLVSFNLSNAQIKNENTDSEKISGNCGMCKKTIEKAGNVKDIASVNWDKETKIASISYDAKKTNKDEILKRIALAGYDSESFLAPDEAYNNLPGCCQYNRENKTATIKKPEMKMEMKEKMKMKSSESAKPLALVYNTYFELKDALVASDSKVVSEKANDLLASIEKADMKSLKMDVHMVWMKNLKPIKEEVKIIVSAKNIEQQREQFIGLSDNMYKVMKIEKSETPIYHQHCPMANDGKGANWLSKEEKVKNPYYGSKMLSCGKIVETIQ